MNLPAYQSVLTPEEYLEGETRSEIRHEYVNGEVYAMSGASEAHNLIAGNLFVLLRNHLRGTPCRVFISDMKTRIKSLRDERYYYPDIQVTCAPEDREPYFKQRPKLVIEVLSPSTERSDRAEKLSAYRKLESLEEYVLVAQDARRVEIYRRESGWDLELHQEDAGFRLTSVGLELRLDQVYEDVEIAPPPRDPFSNGEG